MLVNNTIQKLPSRILGLCAMVLTSLIFSCEKQESEPMQVASQHAVTKNSARNIKRLASPIDMMVMDNNFELIYLGSLLKGNDLITGSNFNPQAGYVKLPITVSSSINGTSSRVISVPRLSTYRQNLQDILRSTTISDPDISSFFYYYRPFNDYNELKSDFGYNVNTRGLFSSASSSTTEQLTTITKSNGIVIGFELINFTMDMSLPKSTELMSIADKDAIVSGGSVPIYVSSISYGQKGVFAIETDYSAEITNSVFEKITRKIFKKTTETLTNTEIEILNNCTIRVFLAGGSNSGSVLTISGYESFLNHIKDLGTFSADNPGYPVSFRCRKIEDFSIFSINP